LGCSSTYDSRRIRKSDIKTFQVNFRNTSELAETGIDRIFTLALQDLLQDATRLSLSSSNGDLVYEGEITDYRKSPVTVASGQKAVQSRLSIHVRVRFTNKKKEKDNFEKDFSFFYDYPANSRLEGEELNTALKTIFDPSQKKFSTTRLQNGNAKGCHSAYFD
jgi:hypothetical protein